jgi:hypothetical protein
MIEEGRSAKGEVVIRVCSQGPPPKPVANAKLTVTAEGQRVSYQDTTDSQGRSKVFELPGGQYSVAYSALEHSGTQPFEVEPGRTCEVDIKIQFSFAVATYVVRPDCTQLPCADVTTGTTLICKAEHDTLTNPADYNWFVSGCLVLTPPEQQNQSELRVRVTTVGPFTIACTLTERKQSSTEMQRDI